MNKRITKVTTKTGDKGTTGMADGSRVSKSDPVIVSIGEVDELNSLIGYLSSLERAKKHEDTFNRIQNCLFDIGGSLSMGTNDSVNENEILFIEREIKNLNNQLPELENFILPGGDPSAAIAQFARAVCRRCERSLVDLSRTNEVEGNKLIFLNRLSDLLFIMGRSINKDSGHKELYWSQN